MSLGCSIAAQGVAICIRNCSASIPQVHPPYPDRSAAHLPARSRKSPPGYEWPLRPRDRCPCRWSGRVMIASAPNDSTAFLMRSSSVATTCARLRTAYALHHMLDHRAACNRGQWFAWESRRGVARGDYGENLVLFGVSFGSLPIGPERLFRQMVTRATFAGGRSSRLRRILGSLRISHWTTRAMPLF